MSKSASANVFVGSLMTSALEDILTILMRAHHGEEKI
jgi:hypothetical protein